MRVAFLVEAFPLLSETFILNQITGLIDAGLDVDVYASRPGDRSRVHADVERYRLAERTRYRDMPRHPLWRAVEAGRRVVRERAWRRPDVLLGALNVRAHGRKALSLGLLYSTLPFLGRPPYDIVHCQFGTLAPAALALHAIGAARGRLVVSFRGNDLTTMGRSLGYTEVFRRGDLFLPVCRHFKDRLVELGCDASKVRVHHSGIRVSRFPYTERHRAVDEPTTILTVGRLVEKKGLAYGVQAIAKVKASGRRVRYVVVGDGPLRSRLQRMVADLGLEAEVELAGARHQDEVVAFLHSAHLFLAPCVTAENGGQEGIPNVLKEAMAAGIPVISTRHSGIPELVRDGASGVLVPERDVDALATGLIDLIDHPERWPDMARAARRHIEGEFDSDTLNAELIALYEALHADSRPAPCVP